MKRILLSAFVLLVFAGVASAQNVFDPSDPIVRYDSKQPLGSQKHPDPAISGLQKWVSVPVIGVSAGSDTFDASSFKQYFINYKGQGMAFRLKFPKSYSNPDSSSKKYPVMLFLHGGGEVGCSTNGGIYNNERPIWLGGKYFRDAVNKGRFDGFLLYPQFVITDGCFSGWLNAPSADFDAIVAIIDSLSKYVRADIDRVVANGLSGGGYGCFRMAGGWPKTLAKIMPTSTYGPINNRANFVHIPIWFATGALDPEPSPAQAEATYNTMKGIGADIRYTQFPTLGHNCWNQHWNLPDYLPEMNSAHKANPLIFFQHNQFCDPADINAKLGLTAGFYAYEWQKDGVTIATSVAGANTIVLPIPVISFTGNEITVKEFGTYRARFKRKIDSDWSAWSPKPAVISSKSTTQTAAIQVNGLHSKVLPALDGSTTVPLGLPDGFLNYRWFRSSDEQQLDTNQVFNAPIGTFKARYSEEFGCSTLFSPDFTVVDANGTPKPEPATALTAVPLTQTVNKLDWTQAAGTTDAQSGFEVYRATTSGGPYQFVALLGATTKTFKDSSLTTNTVYYYKVRAVNGTGAAAASNEAAAKTVTDKTPPTAPSNLTATTKSNTEALLKWNASTDNVAVARYDIYVNGVKLYTTTLLQFTVGQLDSSKFYTFIVKAVDSAENVSPPSNQATLNTIGKTPDYTPGVPSSLTATAINYTEINLTWADTLSNETGYEIVRSLTDGGTYTPVGTVNKNQTSFTDSGLVATKTYFYKIRAIAAGSQSDYSTSVSATTGDLPATPVPPTDLTGSVAPSGNIALNWSDNSSNETGFSVYRSSDNHTFTLLSSLPANSNAYTDTTATGVAVYYYYVSAGNDAGSSNPSDTVSFNAGNQAPVLTGLNDIFVRVGNTASLPFTATDDAGDFVTVSMPNRPSFITVLHPSEGNYTIKATPTSDNVGVYTQTIIATDNHGKATSSTITITVGDQASRSIYVNFGSNGKLAAAPWNNWLGARADNDVLVGLKDETNTTTTINITTVNAWSTTGDMGHITGNNSGVFPDDVLQSGLVDSSGSKQIKLSGLNTAMQYNIALVGSQNEGITATSTYAAGTQSVSLNARYNMHASANLNNLVPDANGEILITVTRAADAPKGYLNGLAIEEYATTVQMVNPSHLYAEALDKTTVNLTWNDRTNNENADDGYEISRATDSLFTKNVTTISLPANTVSYSNKDLAPNTKYWYRVRAKGASAFSDYSNRFKVITPSAMVYVNFNTTVEPAAAPWNSLSNSPLATFTTDPLKNESGASTNITMTLTKEFNGEFTAGVNTGNNSGMVPDNALRADYWLDKNQQSQFVVKGLNLGKRYTFGYYGSSSTPDWFKGNYTATFNINDRTVYLNSWLNSTKIMYISNVSPDQNGQVALNFSTTPEAGYGFNGGVILMEYNDTAEAAAPIDTTGPVNPPDTIPVTPPVDTTGTTPVDTTTHKASKLKVYPNPLNVSSFHVSFYNSDASNDISLEIFDPRGVLTFRRQYGKMQKGDNAVQLTTFESNLKSGLYIVTLKVGGKVSQSVKLIRIRY